MESTIRVLLADDHPLMRAGIRATLVTEEDFTFVGEATNGDEVWELCCETKPDVVLLDLNMPGPPAVDTVRFLHEQCPDTNIMILTTCDDGAYVRSLISAGAVGYVLKEEAADVLARAIRAVVQGDTWFSRAVVEKMASLAIQEQPAGAVVLSERERQVLQLVVAGETDRQIGHVLGLAERTVRHYLQSIYSKLGVGTRVEAAVHAVSMGLVKEPEGAFDHK